MSEASIGVAVLRSVTGTAPGSDGSTFSLLSITGWAPGCDINDDVCGCNPANASDSVTRAADGDAPDETGNGSSKSIFNGPLLSFWFAPPVSL